jgi:hypothetical protein
LLMPVTASLDLEESSPAQILSLNESELDNEGSERVPPATEPDASGDMASSMTGAMACMEQAAGRGVTYVREMMRKTAASTKNLLGGSHGHRWGGGGG